MSINMTNSNKSDNKKEQKATEHQMNEQNKSSNMSEAVKDNEKSNTEAKTEQEDNKIGGGKCVVEYVGNSIWVDSNNNKWSRNDVKGTSIKSQRTYSAQEYESRDDLKFMVEYGEMKLTIVE